MATGMWLSMARRVHRWQLWLMDIYVGIAVMRKSSIQQSSPLTYKLLAGEQALGQWRELFGGYFGSRISGSYVGGSNCLIYVDHVPETLLFAQCID